MFVSNHCTIVIILSNHLKSGKIKSCGCLNKQGNPKHGLRYTRLYRIWINMKTRCYNKNTNRYKDYGARGITICNEWRNDFMSFYNWSMNNGYDENLTIDRINNDKNYEPSNCRWITVKEQNRNKRNNIKEV